MRYAVVIERGPTSFGASVPDLPGCVAVASTREAVEHLIQDAIAVHVAELRDVGIALPASDTRVAMVEVA